jgi:hypothetical protein
MRIALMVLLAFCGCRTGIAEGDTPTNRDGSTSRTPTADGGTRVSGANVCPDFVVTPNMRYCRSAADCGGNRNELCLAPSANFGPVGCVSGVAPPRSQCSRDGDCKLGEQCQLASLGCGQYGTCFQSSCAAAGCQLGDRCRSDGHCEPIPCAEGWACSADQKCSPDPTTVLRDGHGCSPRLCTEGWACPAGQTCDLGGYLSDGHGCRRKNCREGVGCPGWQQCQQTVRGTSTITECGRRSCQVDADCPCGACVAQSCESGPGVCGQPPSYPP